MEDREDSMWEDLGSINAFITSPTHSSSSPSPPWAWSRPPLPTVLQVRLDGEPAEDAPDLDLLLPSLPVATGRIEKPLPHQPPHLTLPPPLKKERPKPDVKPEPVIPLNNDFVPIPAKPSVPQPVVQPTAPPPPPPPPSLSNPTPATAPTTAPATTPRTVPAKPSPPASAPAPTKAPTAIPPSTVTAVSTVKTAPVRKVEPVLAEPSVSLKEKREREARQFPRETLGNLDGTTSAEVRKMNATERELVLYKRKLRNRESARRSRQKRQATLAELQEEIDDLMQVTGRMVEVGIALHEENVRLRDRLSLASKEIARMKSVYGEDDADPSASSAALKMKLGG